MWKRDDFNMYLTNSFLEKYVWFSGKASVDAASYFKDTL